MAIRKPREVRVSPAGTLKTSELLGVVTYAPKDRGKATASGQYRRFGKVRCAVFAPDGRQVVGVLVRRPDVAGMVKRPDAFVALDALAPCDGGLRVTRGKDAYDAAACRRLGIDWDQCIIWEGMDARCEDGRKLGYVDDAVFVAWSGEVQAICVGDGSVARQLVGHVEVPVEMVRGYADGFLVVDDAAGGLALSGGVAAKAGEGYAKAKVAGAQAVERAGEAVDAGSRALGKQLGRTRGMFGSFMDEYKKASK